MKSKLGALFAAMLLLGLAPSALAKGKGSTPQFPAPSPAAWYANECTASVSIEWTAVLNNYNYTPPTKYAIEIIQTFHSGCPDGPVSGSQVNNFTAPGNTTEFTTPDGVLQFGELCGPDDVVVLVKALNPPGKSQNNPQAVAEFQAIGGC